MVFHIFDQGSRISTPAEALFPAGGVEATTATSRAKPVRAHEERPLEHAEQVRAYEESARGDEEQRRRRVRRAADIMVRQVITLSVEVSVGEAWRKFAQSRVHHLPVVDADQKLQGIVTDRDLLRASVSQPGTAPIDELPIRQVMQARVIGATEEADIRLLAEVMLRQKVGAIPITDDEGVVRGIVTRSDILRLLVNQGPLELWG